MNSSSCVLIFLLLSAVSDAARILALFPIGSKSHKLAAFPIIEALAEKGHKVVVFSPYKPVKETANIVEYKLDIPDFLFHMDWFDTQKESPLTQTTTMMLKYRREMIRNYEALRDHKELRRILDERQVDLIFTDGLSTEYLPLIDQLGIPVVNHLSNAVSVGHVRQCDVNKDYASVPNGLTDFDDNMNFTQRMINFLLAEIFRLISLNYITYPIDQLIRKDFPNYRGYLEASMNVDLILANSHHTSAWPRSLPPNVIPLGSVHTRPANPLEEVSIANRKLRIKHRYHYITLSI